MGIEFVSSTTDDWRYVLQFNQTDWSTNLASLQLVDKSAYKYIYPQVLSNLDTAIFRHENPGDISDTLKIEPSAQYTEGPHSAVPAYSMESFSGMFVLLVYCSMMISHVSVVVGEKQNKNRLILKIMGMRDSCYLFAQFVDFMIMGLLITASTYAAGFTFDLDLFVSGNFWIVLISNCLLCLSLFGVALLISVLTTTTKAAGIISFMFLIISTLLSSFTIIIYTDYISESVQLGLSVLCPLPYAQALSFMQTNGSDMSSLNPTGTIFPIAKCWLWMVYDFLIFFIPALYLDAIMESNSGEHRTPWLTKKMPTKITKDKEHSKLPVDDDVARENQIAKDAIERNMVDIPFCSCGDIYEKAEIMHQAMKLNIISDEDSSSSDTEDQHISSPSSGKQMTPTRTPASALDDDEATEHSGAESKSEPNPHVKSSHIAFAVSEMVKDYGRGKDKFRAVDLLSLTVRSGEILGLLGPNGAGKTSAMATIIGTLDATSGEAMLEGVDLFRHFDRIRSHIGYCPQFDSIYENLTAEEHIMLVARIKGYVGKQIVQEVKDRLTEVKLYNVRHRLVKSFSGGMIRRLSVAMALTCDPKVMLFDEATTGLDIGNQHIIWKLVKKHKRGKAIVWTTHSMAEADAVSDRVAIMAAGRLACVGPSLHLKNKFGTGFRFVCNVKNGTAERVASIVTSSEKKANVVASAANEVVFSLAREDRSHLSSLLKVLERKTTKLAGLRDFSVSLSSLEDVFIAIARSVKRNAAGLAIIEEERDEEKDEKEVKGAVVKEVFAPASDSIVSKKSEDKK
eukprot:gnl/Carplike_NY0171/1249_a1687_1195.p1 GENE.gnl/Carplike_NY0171/1249_a1687_1195~~gnl/Carplike_NY0171/1249_a1687_1195.p1  ORF type:complete len:933 (-),score=314.60 gnl/Carplike_NY0171/1249_a1687_1195:271-2652(-)